MLRVVLLLTVVLMAGCASRVPVAVNHPLTTQKKAKAAHHWDVLADDIARQTQAAVSRPGSALKDQELYIQPGGKTSFDHAFRNFLITRLVNRGVAVTSDTAKGKGVSYETQLVRHESSRYTHVPGTLTALTAGIWVVRDIAGDASSAIPATIGIAGLADYALGLYAGEATHTELVVTTTIMDQSRYFFRKTDIYYIEDDDVDLFAEVSEGPVKQLGVVGR
ncbi:MAG: hypothetical protein FPO08_08470 [Geobacter sp.]|nr:MAG: hypothetical protein FPO08_08470 [Geobacter sp.]